MRDFKFFIQKKDVKKQSIDRNLANSLVKDSFERFNYYKTLNLTEQNAKYVLENVYESLREIADAILTLEGWKSYFHEATIAK